MVLSACGCSHIHCDRHHRNGVERPYTCADARLWIAHPNDTLPTSVFRRPPHGLPIRPHRVAIDDYHSALSSRLLDAAVCHYARRLSEGYLPPSRTSCDLDQPRSRTQMILVSIPSPSARKATSKNKAGDILANTSRLERTGLTLSGCEKVYASTFRPVHEKQLQGHECSWHA